MSDYTDSDREQANWREIDRLRAELAELQSIRRIYEAQLDRQALELGYARAAIARVRELCESSEADGHVSFYPEDVLRALDGGN